MKNSRLVKYLLHRKQRQTPITKKQDVEENPDNKIDQDFPGFPHAPGKEEWIRPETGFEKKVVGQDENPKNSTGSTITSTSKGKDD